METKKTNENDLVELYKLLSADLPTSAVQRSKGAETHKGYDTTGFGYQFIVNRFNEVLGIGGWNWNFEELERAEGSYKSGQKFFSITGKTTITLFFKDKEISHSEYGGHQSASITDALKGASTNAFKKTAAFFGVGKQAFEKTIDEDNSADKKEIKNFKPTSSPEQKQVKKTLEQTLLMIDAIATEKAVDVWEQQLEKTDAWTEVQKRVIRGRLDNRRSELKK
jgi:hypothetical protein